MGARAAPVIDMPRYLPYLLERFRRLGGTVHQREARSLLGDCHVLHDYGHGGAGVTLSWGCAEEVVALVGGITAGAVPVGQASNPSSTGRTDGT